MKLFKIKLSTDKPKYKLVSYQLTAENIEKALSESIKRLKQNNLSLKKIESVDVFLESSKTWLPLLELPTDNR